MSRAPVDRDREAQNLCVGKHIPTRWPVLEGGNESEITSGASDGLGRGRRMLPVVEGVAPLSRPNQGSCQTVDEKWCRVVH